MADQKDLDFTYSLIDRMFRASFGEHGSFSGAKYDGDFSLTLEEAQNRKHEYIFEQLNICRGNKVIDRNSLGVRTYMPLYHNIKLGEKASFQEKYTWAGWLGM